MSVRLTDEQRALRDAVRELADERIAPRAAEIDAKAEFPWDVVKLLAEHDVLALPFPAEHGGLGADLLTTCLAVEQIARVCATSSLIVAVQALGSLPLLLAGSDEQKARWFPDLAAGRMLAAFALTEPEAGSDAAALRTRAVREGRSEGGSEGGSERRSEGASEGGSAGDGDNDSEGSRSDSRGGAWRIDGSKRFITHGSVAGLVTVFAQTDTDPAAVKAHRHLTCFAVEQGTPGFSAGKLEHKMGIRGSPTAELMFDGVRVPDSQRVGAVGDGWRIAMATLDRSRPGVAAQAVGLAQGATEVATSYATERRQFGRPIGEFELIQGLLADMAARTEAARQLLYAACEEVESGSPRAARWSAMCKLVAGDTAMAVTTDAVQVLGGYGYIADYPVERMMRDAKITQLYEGTQQIQRLVVARDLLAHGA